MMSIPMHIYINTHIYRNGITSVYRYVRRVLRSLTRALHARGYHVLRYNSRGVGKSTGWPSFTGSREARDLRELVSWALGQIKPAPTTLVVIVRLVLPSSEKPPILHI